MEVLARRVPEAEISLRTLVGVILAHWRLILAMTVASTSVGTMAAFLVHKRYQASVVISPVSDSSSGSQLGSIGSLASQFNGLASLAGISISGDSQRAESLAVLQSEALTEAYIQKNNLLPILYQKRWDPIAGQWRDHDPEKIPTLWKANQYFKSKIRSVTTDTKTGLVTLTIAWTSPVLAAKWANELVKMTNDYLRDKAIRESEQNISYLTEQAAKTDVVGVKQAIFTIMQTEINKVMLAKGSSEYALKVLDPAFAPERPSSPNLTLYVLIGIFSGLFSSLFFIFMGGAWRGGKSDAGSVDVKISR